MLGHKILAHKSSVNCDLVETDIAVDHPILPKVDGSIDLGSSNLNNDKQNTTGITGTNAFDEKTGVIADGGDRADINMLSEYKNANNGESQKSKKKKGGKTEKKQKKGQPTLCLSPNSFS